MNILLLLSVLLSGLLISIIIIVTNVLLPHPVIAKNTILDMLTW